jgi:hypothetical protein
MQQEEGKHTLKLVAFNEKCPPAENPKEERKMTGRSSSRNDKLSKPAVENCNSSNSTKVTAIRKDRWGMAEQSRWGRGGHKAN